MEWDAVGCIAVCIIGRSSAAIGHSAVHPVGWVTAGGSTTQNTTPHYSSARRDRNSTQHSNSARQFKARQGKARQGKARQGKARQDTGKGRQRQDSSTQRRSKARQTQGNSNQRHSNAIQGSPSHAKPEAMQGGRHAIRQGTAKGGANVHTQATLRSPQMRRATIRAALWSPTIPFPKSDRKIR